jgi:pilus assembly protein FimV
MRLSKALGRWLFLVLLPFHAFALSLGEIDLRSSLNEPFNAEISLDAAPGEDLTSLDVRLADAATFERYGLDRPQFLSGLQFNVARDETGQSIIRLTSLSPVAEPFVTVLLDVRWASGRLLREYTVLLDPPLYEDSVVQQPALAAPVAEPSADPAVEGPVERPIEIPPEPVAEEFTQAEPAPQSQVELTFEPPAETAPAAPPAALADPVPATELGLDESAETTLAESMPLEPAGPAAGVTPGNYEVQRGDTLWELADDVRGGSGLTINQMMLALYRANPEAFIGNINGLKAGAILRIPGEEEIALISRSEATAEVREQNNAWQAGAGFGAPDATTPRLELVAPDTDVVDVAPAVDSVADAVADGVSQSAQQELAELKGQVAQLESELTNNERLLEVRDAELAALQARIQALEAEAGVQDAGQPLSELEAEAEFEAEVEAELDAEIDAALLEQETAGADAVQDGDVQPAPPEVTEESLLDRLLSNIWLYVGAGVVILLVALLAMRRRKQSLDEEAFSTGDWDTPPLDAVEAQADADSTATAESAAQDLADSIVVEESAPLRTGQFEEVARTGQLPEESPVAAAPDAPGDAGQDDMEVPLEQTISTGAPMNLDQSDPIAEAEFHMAYGLYDQAADLLVKALAGEPDNRAYRVKLIEVYFVWENQHGFMEQARALHEGLDAAGQSDWNKVVILGKQLCPDDELFAGKETAAPTADAMDLELPEEQQTSVDFNIGDADLGEIDPSMDISLDLDVPSEDEALDLDFGAEHETDMSNSYPALDLTNIESGEAAQGDTVDASLGEDTIESPTIDADMGAATLETPTIEADMSASTMETPTIESPALSGADGADSTAVTQESPTVESFHEAGAETAELPDIDLDEIDIGDLELPDALDDELTADFAAADDEDSDATRLMADPAGLPKGEAESEVSSTLEIPDFSDDMTADFGTDTPLTDDTAEQPVLADDGFEAAVAEDDATQEMPTEATMTEVGTKLDLARAYIDMGDPDGARSILNEVLVEGTEAQRQEAQQLLGDLED